MAVNASGSLITVAGYTDSKHFPTTLNALDPDPRRTLSAAAL